MPDRWAVALAVSAAAGALAPSTVPLGLGAAAALMALRLRWPFLLCLATALCTSALAERALAGLEGVEEGLVHGHITLLSDPRPAGGGLRADGRLGRRRVELRAGGASAAALAPRLAGEVVRVRGRLRPLPPEPWFLARHVSGRLHVTAVEGWRSGGAPERLANALRRNLAEGARSLPAAQRALYAGLVVGDDRAHPPELTDDFLGSGLTHLLAVSGQNVGFCLVLAAPVLRRLRLWPRLGATLGVIALFGLMTRFEASVLRASAMAALAATVVTIGRPVSRLRVVALATTGLLLVDPLLVHSVGFRLSLAAASAIVVLGRPLAALLPGPAALREPLAVTVAAQLGVAPVLLATFGPMPVASLPANLLAVPVAGLVMMWGMTAGMVAGLVGEPLAGVLHVPTGLALAWLSTVADRAASAPLGELHLWHTAAAAAALGLGAAAARAGAPVRWRSAPLAVAGTAVAAAVLVAHAAPGLRHDAMPGLVRWHAAGSEVVVLGGAGGRTSLAARPVLEALRRAGTDAVELLVVADGGVPIRTVAALARAHRVGHVVAHRDAHSEVEAALDVPVARAPPGEVLVQVGGLEVRIVPAGERLVVDARRR